MSKDFVDLLFWFRLGLQSVLFERGEITVISHSHLNLEQLLLLVGAFHAVVLEAILSFLSTGRSCLELGSKFT